MLYYAVLYIFLWITSVLPKCKLQRGELCNLFTINNCTLPFRMTFWEDRRETSCESFAGVASSSFMFGGLKWNIRIVDGKNGDIVQQWESLFCYFSRKDMQQSRAFDQLEIDLVWCARKYGIFSSLDSQYEWSLSLFSRARTQSFVASFTFCDLPHIIPINFLIKESSNFFLYQERERKKLNNTLCDFAWKLLHKQQWWLSSNNNLLSGISCRKIHQFAALDQ